MAEEKTHPVNVGEDARAMVLAIQSKVKEQIGYEVTQRAVAERAISKLHDEVCKVG